VKQSIAGGGVWWGAIAALPLLCFFLAARSASAAGDSVSDGFVALVVGIGNYQDKLALTQPAADAAAVVTSLRIRGFQIISSGASGCGESGPTIDPSRSSFQAAVSCLAKAATRAKQAVFYFSGHSISREGKNFLAPGGLSADDLSRPEQLIELKSVLDALEPARPDLTLVILDAARAAVKDVPGTTTGLAHVPRTTGSLRIVAFSAPAGGWADGAGQTGGQNDASDKTLSALSPYTRRLVQAIDGDSESRSLDQPGANLDALLLKAATSQGAAAAEILNENAGGGEMIGRMPRIGKSACDILNWRAENFGHCVEIGAAYEHCGKDTAMRRMLQTRCPADWKSLVRYSLRASMVAAMKLKTCAALRDLVTKFEQESGGKELDEYKEVSSLAQYTCSTETRDRPSQPPPRTPPAKVAASVAPAKTATSAAPETAGRNLPSTAVNFVVGDNRDIYGQDIPSPDGTIGFLSTDIAACIGDCQSNPLCVGVSFDRWKGKCYPKNKIVTALLDARSSIAVRKPLQLPPVSAAKADFQTLRNSRFGASPFTRRRVAEFGACRSTCEGESRCLAFGFLKSAARNVPNCELFELTAASSRDSSVDSAYKFQSPP
jgi:hypothetical protein